MHWLLLFQAAMSMYRNTMPGNVRRNLRRLTATMTLPKHRNMPLPTLSFMASNITQQDIDSINDTQPATVEVEDMEISESMTEAKATVSVYGWMRKHDIGSIPKMTDECQLTVAMVKEGKQWKVRMEAPLQSGMQSRGSSQDEQ